MGRPYYAVFPIHPPMTHRYSAAISERGFDITRWSRISLSYSKIRVHPNPANLLKALMQTTEINFKQQGEISLWFAQVKANFEPDVIQISFWLLQKPLSEGGEADS